MGQENYVEYSSYPGMCVLQAHTLRNLVDMANNEGILKDDIVGVIQEEGTFFLLYYK